MRKDLAPHQEKPLNFRGIELDFAFGLEYQIGYTFWPTLRRLAGGDAQFDKNRMYNV